MVCVGLLLRRHPLEHASYNGTLLGCFLRTATAFFWLLLRLLLLLLLLDCLIRTAVALLVLLLLLLGCLIRTAVSLLLLLLLLLLLWVEMGEVRCQVM